MQSRVTGKRDEVGPECNKVEVDPTDHLSRIQQDLRIVPMGEFDHRFERQQIARNIGRGRDRDELDIASGKLIFNVVQIQWTFFARWNGFQRHARTLELQQRSVQRVMPPNAGQHAIALAEVDIPAANGERRRAPGDQQKLFGIAYAEKLRDFTMRRNKAFAPLARRPDHRVPGGVCNDLRFWPTRSRVVETDLPFRHCTALALAGLSLDLSAIDWTSSFFRAFSLIVGATAIVGKVAAGLIVPEQRHTRAVVGMAMVPRGEVGIIFAEPGLVSGLFDNEVYAAVVIVVAYTTLVSLFWIKLHYRMYGEYFESVRSDPGDASHERTRATDRA